MLVSFGGNFFLPHGRLGDSKLLGCAKMVQASCCSSALKNIAVCLWSSHHSPVWSALQVILNRKWLDMFILLSVDQNTGCTVSVHARFFSCVHSFLNPRNGTDLFTVWFGSFSYSSALSREEIEVQIQQNVVCVCVCLGVCLCMGVCVKGRGLNIIYFLNLNDFCNMIGWISLNIFFF